MNKFLLSLLLTVFTGILHAQKDTASFTGSGSRYVSGESTSISMSLYPVPVRNNSFTIKTDRDISFVKITNIIGQDICRIKYNNPQQLIKINLDNPQRGMYLVTVIFRDGTRIVKKIMIEESE